MTALGNFLSAQEGLAPKIPEIERLQAAHLQAKDELDRAGKAYVHEDTTSRTLFWSELGEMSELYRIGVQLLFSRLHVSVREKGQLDDRALDRFKKIEDYVGGLTKLSSRLAGETNPMPVAHLSFNTTRLSIRGGRYGKPQYEEITTINAALGHTVAGQPLETHEEETKRVTENTVETIRLPQRISMLGESFTRIITHTEGFDDDNWLDSPRTYHADQHETVILANNTTWGLPLIFRYDQPDNKVISHSISEQSNDQSRLYVGKFAVELALGDLETAAEVDHDTQGFALARQRIEALLEG